MRFFSAVARSRTAAAISAIGSIVPTSLLAVMMLTSVVSRVIARATSTGSTMPWPSTGRIRDLEAEALEILAGVQYRVVFDLRCDDVVASARFLLLKRDALDSRVDRLCTRRREDDFRRAHAEDSADRLARAGEAICCVFRDAVGRGRVAVDAGQVGHHRLEGARVERRRRSVVEIDEARRRHDLRLAASGV